MHKLHVCCFTCHVIACSRVKLSALHVHTAHHEDRMHAIDHALTRNSQQISQATVLCRTHVQMSSLN